LKSRNRDRTYYNNKRDKRRLMKSITKDRPWLAYQPEVIAILEKRKTQFRRVVKTRIPIQPNWILHSAVCGRYNGSFRFRIPDSLNEQIVEGVNSTEYVYCPYGYPGEKLRVKESFWQDKRDQMICFEADHTFMLHPNDNAALRSKYIGTLNESMLELKTNPYWTKKPATSLPKWASRIPLNITNRRVEMLQEISKKDIRAEGISLPMSPRFTPGGFSELHQEFREYWNSFNGKWKGIYKKIKGHRILVAYECYPWAKEDIPPIPTTARKYQIPCRAYPNPYVWVVEFQSSSN